MFGKLLIANRGEIAVRIARTARRMGVATVAVHSDADRNALHVASCDEAIAIGPAPASQSYLNIPAVLEAARVSGADAIHPGYGFLSENPGFVEAVEGAGLIFVGPPASAIRAMGLKDAAKALMERAGVPVVPGYLGADQSPARLAEAAAAIGYPVMIKASAGGGGKGMRRVDDAGSFSAALDGAKREALAAFGNDHALIEKCLVKPRHIEVQVFADNHGGVVHLHERDCSLQRRHQKVIEEAPAPGMTADIRAAMGQAAVMAARAVGYRNAGTVEFIADVSEGLSAGRFYFMEMNTRLQVEHPVTEMITGLDLVEWQLRIAAGEALPLQQDEVRINGHAFEARLYAEDPSRGFLPQTGVLKRLNFASGRADTGVRQGDGITPHYDPMIAKLVAHGDTRAEALAALRLMLERTEIAGCTTNLAFLHRLARDGDFARGEVDTGLIDRNITALADDLPPPPAALMAAMAHEMGLGAVAGSSPYRHWGPYRRTIWFRGSPPLQFEDAIQGMTMKGTPFSVTNANAGAVSIQCGGHRTDWHVFDADDAIHVHGAGGLFRLLRDAAGLIGPADEGGGDIVRSHMPGLVRLVHVAPGDRVKRGDVLMLTEAMKMEHAVQSPRDGVIASVAVAQGSQIRDGDTLATLEAKDG